MTLTLDVVKSGKSKPFFKSLRFEKKGGIIGRSDQCDYQLTDPHNHISGRHAYVEYQYDRYYIRDESTNGTFLKFPYKKLSKGIPHPVAPSEIYIIGDHELQVRLDEDKFTDDYIVGTFSPEPEPLDAIDELIPDDDFLKDDDHFHSLLTGDSHPVDLPQKNVMDFLEPNIFPLDSDNLIPEEPEHIPTQEIYGLNISIPSLQETTESTAVQNHSDNQDEKLIKILEKRLGFEIGKLTKQHQLKLFNEIGHIVVQAIEGIRNTDEMKEKIKLDLGIKSQESALHGSLISGCELETMLTEGTASSMMNQSLHQINNHLIAMHGASKEVVKSSLNLFEPGILERQFESSGELKGALPRSCLMWRAYMKMFERQKTQNSSGGVFLPHFIREYEKVIFSVSLSSSANAILQKGIK